MVNFFPDISDDLNADGDASDNIDYRSASTGEPVKAGVYIEKKNNVLFLTTISVLGPNNNSANAIASTLIKPPSQTRFVGARVVSQVLADMAEYARSRNMAGVGAGPVVNPALAVSLLKQGYTTGSPAYDAEVMRALTTGNLRTNTNFLARAHNLQRQRGLMLVKKFT